MRAELLQFEHQLIALQSFLFNTPLLYKYIVCGSLGRAGPFPCARALQARGSPASPFLSTFPPFSTRAAMHQVGAVRPGAVCPCAPDELPVATTEEKDDYTTIISQLEEADLQEGGGGAVWKLPTAGAPS